MSLILPHHFIRSHSSSGFCGWMLWSLIVSSILRHMLKNGKRWLDLQGHLISLILMLLSISLKHSNDDVVKAHPLSSTNLSGPIPKRAAAFWTRYLSTRSVMSESSSKRAFSPASWTENQERTRMLPTVLLGELIRLNTDEDKMGSKNGNSENK